MHGNGFSRDARRLPINCKVLELRQGLRATATTGQVDEVADRRLSIKDKALRGGRFSFVGGFNMWRRFDLRLRQQVFICWSF